MICHQVSFENTCDKHIDYNLLLETPYYYQPSPTPSTPLSSPTYSLIQEETSMRPHQQDFHTPPSLMACPQNTSNNDDWLLDPFYDLNSFSYNPLVVPSAEPLPLPPRTMDSTTPTFDDPMITMMMMAEGAAEAPPTAPVSPPHVMADCHPSPKKSCKRKSVPYANQMRSLNFNQTTPSSSTVEPPAAPRAKRVKQTSPSPYRCDFSGCDKSFTRPYNLKSHRRTHTNEKPFDCPHCPKKFARQHDRNRHAKLHLGVKPFFCFLCFKSFARQDALSRHQRWSDDEPGVIGCSTLKRKKTVVQTRS
ncbi:hypothetical protein [Absidia glauca]|uniref:Wilms tumor protein homolog n=1 Tax=Absidia glauca TaxID=4829 RepID=A0A168RTN5_ABSGL|nr:hypothetical protein [Absidia glauca]